MNKKYFFWSSGLLLVIILITLIGILNSDQFNSQMKSFSEKQSHLSSQTTIMASQSEQMSGLISKQEDPTISVTTVQETTSIQETTTVATTKRTSPTTAVTTTEMTTVATTKTTIPTTTVATTEMTTHTTTAAITETTMPTTTATPTTTEAVQLPENSVGFDANRLIVVRPDLPLNITFFESTFEITEITYEFRKFDDGTYGIRPVYTGIALSMRGGNALIRINAKLYDSSNNIIDTAGATGGRYSDGDNFNIESTSFFYFIPAGTYSHQLGTD